MRQRSFPLVLVTAAALSFVLAAVVQADDFQPPPWRGQPGSTLYHWVFDPGTANPPNPIPPDGDLQMVMGDGGGGGPLATPSQNLIWDYIDSNQNGQHDPEEEMEGWATPDDTSGQILFDLPNWIDFQPLKTLQVQITFEGALPGPSVATISAMDNVTGSDVMVAPIERLIVDEHHILETWQLWPNPDWEIVTLELPGFTLLDQVVFDAISWGVPEPSSLVLWLVGACAAMVVRRRRRA